MSNVLQIPKQCPRCNGSMLSCAMSWFEPQWICNDCSHEEKGAPNYQLARAKELEQVKAWNFNYPGIGLAEVDVEYLRKAREHRGEVKTRGPYNKTNS